MLRSIVLGVASFATTILILVAQTPAGAAG